MSAASRKVRVLIAHRDAHEYARLLQAGPDVDVIAVSDDQAPLELPAADVLMTIGRWLTADQVATAERLKWVHCLISGTDHLRVPLRGRSDIVITNSRGIHGPQMAETAMMHLLTLSRGGRRLSRQIGERNGQRFTPITLMGRTAVVVGVGLIAEHFAKVLRPFGMQIVGVSGRDGTPDGFDRIVPYSKLLEEAANAQVVIAFAPLTEQTRGMFGRDFFAAMNPRGWFINMARGQLVDEAALVSALESNDIAGAALDVFEDFPLPPDSRLWSVENLLLSPFIGGQSDRYAHMAVDQIIGPNLDAYLSGKPQAMQNLTDLERDDA